VLEQSSLGLTKPVVKVFFSTKSGMPLEPRVLDLASSSVADQIETREPPETWNFPYLTDLWGADGALKQARA
jgi:hypothetical protein